MAARDVRRFGFGVLARWPACVVGGLLAAVLPCASAAGPAQPRPQRPVPPTVDVANPGQFQCVGRNRFSGSVIVPVEKQGETSDWAYAAFFTDPVLGTPVIVYGPRFRAMPPLLQAFIRRHECQHAKGIQDEIAANCLALAQMRAQGLSPEQESFLERWHQAEGPLDPQYGGSGAAFWERTLRCAASVR